MEKSSFFNAVLDGNGLPDRAYLAEDFAKYFSTFIGNGIFPNPSNNLQVVAVNNDMTITLKKGMAWINGYLYENTDDFIFKINLADGVLNRIDRLVIRLDFIDREIKAYLKKGNFASNPIAPDIVRNEDYYELALADIKINAGSIKINQNNITDLRLNKGLCGLVHGVVEQVDPTAIFNQYENWYNNKTVEFQQQFGTWYNSHTETWTNLFNIWFDDLKDLFGEDAIGNIYKRIEDTKDELSLLTHEKYRDVLDLIYQLQLKELINSDNSKYTVVETLEDKKDIELITGNFEKGKLYI